MLVVGIKDFKMPRRRRQRGRKKGNRLNSKTVTLHVRHAFSCISLPLLHDYYGKIPSFIFYGGRKQATAKFSFSFRTWVWFLGIRLKRVRLHLQMSWSNRERDWNNANSLFKRRFSGRHRRGVLYFNCVLGWVARAKLQEWSGIHVVWENCLHFATPLLVSSRNDVWETSAGIPYWWPVTTQIWVMLLIGWSKFPSQHDQSEALPRTG